MQCGRWGQGATGLRFVVEIRPQVPGKGYWLLARRSIAQPGELALRMLRPGGNGLGGTGEGGWDPVGHRGCFEEAKGQVGLDQYEVRRWDGWYRHITLAMLARPIVSNQASSWNQGKGGCYGPDEELIPITAPEVRRLLTRLVWTENQLPESCPGRGGDGATKPEPHAITNAACQICDCSTKRDGTG